MTDSSSSPLTWQHKSPKPEPASAVLRYGDIRLGVSTGDGQQWRHFMMSFGRHTPEPLESCVRDWPRHALMVARRKLDEFEQQLEKFETE